MDRPPATDTRQRVTNLIEEAGSLLGMIPRLLDDENEQMRAGMESTRQEAGALREELVAVKDDLEQLRNERDETTRMCIKAMDEAAEVINEMLIKLRPDHKSSPFARDPGAPAADPASRPALHVMVEHPAGAAMFPPRALSRSQGMIHQEPGARDPAPRQEGGQDHLGSGWDHEGYRGA